MTQPRPPVVVAVDDDPAMRRVLSRVLAWRGLTPYIASTREEALALVLEHAPAVVTVDYDLGPCTGADLARDLARELGPHAPPMILVSAAADRIPRAERELFAALHVKPFRASALLDDVVRLSAESGRKRSGVRAVDARIAKRRAENE